MARANAELVPGARLSVIPACGHLPHQEQPQELIAHIE
jgi:pimeloyl-ACP methyl ester carboxylesterase